MASYQYLNVLFIFASIHSADNNRIEINNSGVTRGNNQGSLHFYNDRGSMKAIITPVASGNLKVSGADVTTWNKESFVVGKCVKVEWNRVKIKWFGDFEQTLQVYKGKFYVYGKEVCSYHEKRTPAYQRTTDNTIWFTNCQIGSPIPSQELAGVKRLEKIKDEEEKERQRRLVNNLNRKISYKMSNLFGRLKKTAEKQRKQANNFQQHMDQFSTNLNNRMSHLNRRLSRRLGRSFSDN